MKVCTPLILRWNSQLKAPEFALSYLPFQGYFVNVEEGMELFVDESKTKVGLFMLERLSELTSLDSTVLYIPSLSMSTSMLSYRQYLQDNYSLFWI